MSGQTDFMCLDCMTFSHEAPRCGWAVPALPRGYQAGVQADRTVCWRCSERENPEK